VARSVSQRTRSVSQGTRSVSHVARSDTLSFVSHVKN
jgi:hypothetical protein